MTRGWRGRELILLWILSAVTACVDESGPRNGKPGQVSGPGTAGDPQPMEALLDPAEWAGSTRQWIREYVGSWEVDLKDLEMVEVGMGERKVVQLLGCAGNFVAAYSDYGSEQVRVSVYSVRAGRTSSLVWLTYVNGVFSGMSYIHGISYRYGDLAGFSEALKQGRVNARQVRERMLAPRNRDGGSLGLSLAAEAVLPAIKRSQERDGAENLRIRRAVSGHYAEVAQLLDLGAIPPDWVARSPPEDGGASAVRIHVDRPFGLLPQLHHAPVVVILNSSGRTAVVFGSYYARKLGWPPRSLELAED